MSSFMIQFEYLHTVVVSLHTTYSMCVLSYDLGFHVSYSTK